LSIEFLHRVFISITLDGDDLVILYAND